MVVPLPFAPRRYVLHFKQRNNHPQRQKQLLLLQAGGLNEEKAYLVRVSNKSHPISLCLQLQQLLLLLAVFLLHLLLLQMHFMPVPFQMLQPLFGVLQLLLQRSNNYRAVSLLPLLLKLLRLQQRRTEEVAPQAVHETATAAALLAALASR